MADPEFENQPQPPQRFIYRCRGVNPEDGQPCGMEFEAGMGQLHYCPQCGSAAEQVRPAVPFQEHETSAASEEADRFVRSLPRRGRMY